MKTILYQMETNVIQQIKQYAAQNEANIENIKQLRQQITDNVED